MIVLSCEGDFRKFDNADLGGICKCRVDKVERVAASAIMKYLIMLAS